MALTGKTDEELLEMIYKTSPHGEEDERSLRENIKWESNVSENENATESVDSEKYMKLITAPDSVLKGDEIKQEVLDLHENVIFSNSLTNRDDTDLVSKVYSSPMEITENLPYNDETHDQILKLEKKEIIETDNNTQYVAAVKVESGSYTLESGASQTDDLSDAELYLLTKEELVAKLVSCREELNSLRKQLARSERQLTKSDDYNELLREKVETLSSQIHSFKKGTYTEAAIQVDQNDLINYTIGEPCMPDWSVDLTQGVVHPSTSTAGILEHNDSKMLDDSSMSIADSIKMAAQDVVNKQTQDTLLLQGYVYDENYGLYYHSQSGYYYDAEKMLYYEPHSGTYYYYDYDTGQYAFHSQVNVQDSYYGYGDTTDIQKTKVTNGSTNKSVSSKKKKTSELRIQKAGGKVSEQVFKNRQERRKAMREEQEREIKRKEEKRKRKDKDRDRRRKSSKKRKRKNDDNLDSDDTEAKQDRKKRKSPKKHRKHKKKEKKEKKHKRNSRKDDTEKINENDNTDKSSKDITDVRNDIDENVNDAIDISDEELVISEEEGELNEDIYMDVDEIQASGVENENKDIKSEIRTSESTGEVEDECVKIKIEQDKDEVSSKSVLDKEQIDNCEKMSEDKEMQSVKREQYESISDNSENYISSSESESGEISDSSTDQSDESSDSDDDVYIVHDSEGNEFEEEISEDIVQSWRPCVRVIVTESDCVDVGMLYIVTYQGTSIGRGKENGICLPDINISKFHADIQYNDDDRNYTITDKGSQNGTFVNSERISLPKESSEPKAFKHGDVVQVGDTKLLCHIHSGTDTCDDCEPGIVMARYRELHPKQEVKFISKEERKKMQRQELNEIKKRYGLKNAAYEDPSTLIKNPNYEDKAAERRKTVGSDMPHIKHETPASVHRPISSENKGHKMLEKMGWKEGQSLGKDNTGIQEPIPVSLRINQSAGLGSSMSGVFSVDDANSLDVKKASRRMQALQRYAEIEEEQRDNNTSEMTVEKGEEPNNDNAGKSASKYRMAWTKGATEFT